MQTISRDKVKEETRNHDAKLIEVLDRDQFEKFHLPGAINVPLNDGFDDRIRRAVPRKDEKVILYCQDDECSASARAARRMEEMGYTNVYDYEGGKVDWKRAGLPIEN